MHKRLLEFFLSAFGLGFSPIMPGTLGSLFGVFLIWLISQYDTFPAADALVFIVLLLVTITLLTRYLRLGVARSKDPQFVVMDEVLGIFVTFIALPITWTTLLIGFLIFRIFDIAKPFGIRKLENIEGAWGIVLDDLLAGLLAHIILFLYVKFGAPF